MRIEPPWGKPPVLLPEPVFDPAHIDARLIVEIRPVAPRHLLECYAGGLVRCAQSDEFGFRHPGVEAVALEMRRLNARVDGLFAGSILEFVPESRLVRAGIRHAGVVVTDLYCFDGTDLRDRPFGERRALLEELVSIADRDTVRPAPLLPALRLAHPEHAHEVRGTLRIIPRRDAIVGA